MIYKLSNYKDDNIELHISEEGLVDAELLAVMNVNGKDVPVETIINKLDNSFDIMTYIVDALNELNEELEDDCNDDEDADCGDTLAANYTQILKNLGHPVTIVAEKE